MFPGCLQDFSRMFSGCSDGSYWPGGIWWSFQMKVWTLKIQRNPMIPNYSMFPAAAIWWSPGIRWSSAIRWSIRSMDFDNPKVYGDTSITDGLVFFDNRGFPNWGEGVEIVFHTQNLTLIEPAPNRAPNPKSPTCHTIFDKSFALLLLLAVIYTSTPCSIFVNTVKA